MLNAYEIRGEPASFAVALRPVRDGQKAPIVCAACGCRLQDGEDGLTHFGNHPERDARGCLVACANTPHRLS